MTTAAQLMAEFAARPARHYLWTDAFAVCNYLALDDRERATALVAAVHRELARHRSDDRRRGWISGLDEADGAAHPTLGGLRIGKPLPERAGDEPLDDQLEWDRDGQYFHYLTKWMHALDHVARATREATFSQWARELADSAYRRFSYTTASGRRMYWKMSIDLMRPLVPSMGHHDPLDGYVTYLQLERTARRLAARGPDLSPAIGELRAMIEPTALATPDPLGIGGLLVDASRLAQLDRDRSLRVAVKTAARIGLAHYRSERHQQLADHERRLAFRELGLAIGLAAVDGMDEFAQFARLRTDITTFWSDPLHRQSAGYREHEDINDVMLATALLPNGFTVID